jgi:hypothetical protein
MTREKNIESYSQWNEMSGSYHFLAMQRSRSCTSQYPHKKMTIPTSHPTLTHVEKKLKFQLFRLRVEIAACGSTKPEEKNSKVKRTTVMSRVAVE